MLFWLYGQYIKYVGLYVFDNYVPDSTRYNMIASFTSFDRSTQAQQQRGAALVLR